MPAETAQKALSAAVVGSSGRSTKVRHARGLARFDPIELWAFEARRRRSDELAAAAREYDEREWARTIGAWAAIDEFGPDGASAVRSGKQSVHGRRLLLGGTLSTSFDTAQTRLDAAGPDGTEHDDKTGEHLPALAVTVTAESAADHEGDMDIEEPLERHDGLPIVAKVLFQMEDENIEDRRPAEKRRSATLRPSYRYVYERRSDIVGPPAPPAHGFTDDALRALCKLGSFDALANSSMPSYDDAPLSMFEVSWAQADAMPDGTEVIIVTIDGRKTRVVPALYQTDTTGSMLQDDTKPNVTIEAMLPEIITKDKSLVIVWWPYIKLRALVRLLDSLEAFRHAGGTIVLCIGIEGATTAHVLADVEAVLLEYQQADVRRSAEVVWMPEPISGRGSRHLKVMHIFGRHRRTFERVTMSANPGQAGLSTSVEDLTCALGLFDEKTSREKWIAEKLSYMAKLGAAGALTVCGETPMMSSAAIESVVAALRAKHVFVAGDPRVLEVAGLESRALGLKLQGLTERGPLAVLGVRERTAEEAQALESAVGAGTSTHLGGLSLALEPLRLSPSLRVAHSTTAAEERPRHGSRTSTAIYCITCSSYFTARTTTDARTGLPANLANLQSSKHGPDCAERNGWSDSVNVLFWRNGSEAQLQSIVRQLKPENALQFTPMLRRQLLAEAEGVREFQVPDLRARVVDLLHRAKADPLLRQHPGIIPWTISFAGPDSRPGELFGKEPNAVRTVHDGVKRFKVEFLDTAADRRLLFPPEQSTARIAAVADEAAAVGSDDDAAVGSDDEESVSGSSTSSGPSIS